LEVSYRLASGQMSWSPTPHFVQVMRNELSEHSGANEAQGHILLKISAWNTLEQSQICLTTILMQSNRSICFPFCYQSYSTLHVGYLAKQRTREAIKLAFRCVCSQSAGCMVILQLLAAGSDTCKSIPFYTFLLFRLFAQQTNESLD
jgi:hypothetical protein